MIQINFHQKALRDSKEQQQTKLFDHFSIPAVKNHFHLYLLQYSLIFFHFQEWLIGHLMAT